MYEAYTDYGPDVNVQYITFKYFSKYCDSLLAYVKKQLQKKQDIVYTERIKHNTVLYRFVKYESNRKAMNRNWCNQKANPALKTKT